MALNSNSTKSARSFHPVFNPVCFSVESYKGSQLPKTRNIELTVRVGRREFSLIFEVGFMFDRQRILPNGDRE